LNNILLKINNSALKCRLLAVKDKLVRNQKNLYPDRRRETVPK